MDPPRLTEEVIAQNALPRSLERGRDYYRSGAVVSVVRRGTILYAEVEGSEPLPYQVRVLLQPQGVAEARCSCPYDRGGWCKHIVATLLAYIHEPEEVEEKPGLDEVLAQLERDQLQTLLLRLGSRSLEWMEGIEEEAERLLSPRDGRASPPI